MELIEELVGEDVLDRLDELGNDRLQVLLLGLLDALLPLHAGFGEEEVGGA